MTVTDSLHTLDYVIERVRHVADNLNDADRQLARWAGPGRVQHNGPGGKGGHSDPTAAAALGQDDHGRERVKLHMLILRLGNMARDIDYIVSTTVNPTPAPEPPDGPEYCINMHGCPDEAKAVKGGLCDPCATHRRDHGRDRRQGGKHSS